MDRINGLHDDLLVKILSFLPTKVVVSTSIISKRWKFLWMWVPNIDFTGIITDTNHSMSSRLSYRDFIKKNLPLHRAPIIESLRLGICSSSLQPEDIRLWVGMAVSRCVRFLTIGYFFPNDGHVLVRLRFPSSLYTCKSLVTLELIGDRILVDVPLTVCLPSLKTLELINVTYLNDESLRLLLSYCPVLEDLVIEREEDDNLKSVAVIVPSLQRLSLCIDSDCSSDGYVIDTLSLKYFEVKDFRHSCSYVIKHMPKLEEANIRVENGLKQFLESITHVKRLSLEVGFDYDQESMYRAGIVFNRLEHLKLSICNNYWSKLLFRLLKDSPKLRVLNLSIGYPFFEEYEEINWDNEGSLIPECLLKTLETFKFEGGEERPEEKSFLSFFYKNARCLKSTPNLTLSM